MIPIRVLAGIVLLLWSGTASSVDWDIAVAFQDRVELLTDNGTVVGSTGHQLLNVRGIDYDFVQSYLYLSTDSGPEQSNTSIYRVQVNNEGKTKNLEPVVPGVDSIFGLAFDAIGNRLYWTTHYKIMTAGLDPPHFGVSSILFHFKNETPMGIAVDPCRRYLYWTNPFHRSPSIERSHLNGTGREVLIKDAPDTKLGSPKALALLHAERLMYWISDLDYMFSIQRSDLDGKRREIVFEYRDHMPFGLAVLPDTIYWTERSVGGQVWKIPLQKELDPGNEPTLTSIRVYKDYARGIVARNKHEHLHEEDCKALISIREKALVNWMLDDNCKNGGRMLPSGECQCSRGWTGKMCEVSACFNYCLNNGSCSTALDGSPHCTCRPGFSGSRCHLSLCSLEKGYCLNGGNCSLDVETGVATCSCPKNFTGSRCQMEITLCHLLCSFNRIKYGNVCRCDSLLNKSDGLPQYLISERSNENVTAAAVFADTGRDGSTWEVAAITLVCVASLLFGSVLVLSYKVWSMRKRPKLRKRFRPSVQQQQQQQERRGTAPEHCEIAIENCCNMNICETPCCEPEFRTIKAPSRKLKKEESRGLLDDVASMGTSSNNVSSMY